MKKVIIIVAILAVAAGIVLAGVALRGGGDEVIDDTPPGSLPQGGLPISGSGAGIGGGGINGLDPEQASGSLRIPGLELVSQASVLDYALTPDGELFSMDAAGAVISSSNSEPIIARAGFGGLLGAWFSPGGRWLLVRSGSAGSSRWNLLDVPARTWREIPANTSEMAWSPEGDALAYLAGRANGSTVTTLDPATGTTRTVLALSGPDLRVRWQDSDTLFILDRPSALVQSDIWSVSLPAGGLSLFASGVRGGDVLWGGAESGGLIFRSGPTGGTLALVDPQGGTDQAANFLTLPSKCAFGEAGAAAEGLSGYLFCAIPQDGNLLRSRVLPDSYLKNEFGGQDGLYAIDVLSGSILPLVIGENTAGFDATNLKVYGDGLYFVDRASRNLYRVSLSPLIPPQEETFEVPL